MCFRQVPEDNNRWRSYTAQYFGLEIRLTNSCLKIPFEQFHRHWTPNYSLKCSTRINISFFEGRNISGLRSA